MDGVGFEPTTWGNHVPVFKTGAFNRSATHPKETLIYIRVRTEYNISLHDIHHSDMETSSLTLHKI